MRQHDLKTRMFADPHDEATKGVISVEVGFFASKLRKQLKEQGYTLTNSQASVFQGALDAINTLRVGLMTKTEERRIGTRLLKRIRATAKRMP